MMVYLIVIVVVSGCSGTNDNDTSSRSGLEDERRPDTHCNGCQFELFERGRRTAEILADAMDRYEKIDSTMARVINVDTYDSTGNISGKLIGDSAVIRERTGLMDIYGHVTMVVEDGTILKTEYLRWNPENDQVETDSTFEIKRDDNWATGRKLRANRNLKNIQILQDYQGTWYDTPLLDETP